MSAAANSLNWLMSPVNSRGRLLKLFKPSCHTTIRQNLLQFADRQLVEQVITGSRRRTVDQYIQEQAESTLERYGHFSADWLHSPYQPKYKYKYAMRAGPNKYAAAIQVTILNQQL